MPLDYQFDHAFSFQKRNNLDFRIHAQGEVEIVFLRRGSCHVTCGGAELEIQAGDVFIVFPNQLHKYENSQSVDAYLLVIPIQKYLSVFYHTFLKMIPVDPVLHRNQWDEHRLFPLVERAYEDLPCASEPVLQGYLMVIFGKLLEYIQLKPRQPGSDEALRKVLEYLHVHYRENVTRKQIAHVLGYNESYISHLFSETMHTSLPEYLNTLRTEDACRLLQETGRPIAELCMDLGFQSIRNFNRIFLRRTGMTPRQYRNLKHDNNALPE